MPRAKRSGARCRAGKRAIGPETRLAALESVVLRLESDDWAVLFDPERGTALGINPVGVAVWRLLDGTHTLRHVLAGIQGAFSTVPRTALAEVTAFVMELGDAGLLRETGSASTGS